MDDNFVRVKRNDGIKIEFICGNRCCLLVSKLVVEDGN
jgi:hypothetical protein